MCRTRSLAPSGNPARAAQLGLTTPWVKNALLSTTGDPPFGANGLGFNKAQSILFVANTGNDTIVQIPVNGGTPGTPAIFVNSINGPDGLVIDSDDNLWVAANQSDEIVVVDKTGKVLAKLGDFDGLVNDGTPKGLLFPASPAFSRDGKTLYVTNLALDLRVATGKPENIAIEFSLDGSGQALDRVQDQHEVPGFAQQVT